MYMYRKNFKRVKKNSEIDQGRYDQANLGMGCIDTFVSLFC